MWNVENNDKRRRLLVDDDRKAQDTDRLHDFAMEHLVMVRQVVGIKRMLLDLLTVLSKLKNTPHVAFTNEILDWVSSDATGKSAVEATKDVAQSP